MLDYLETQSNILEMMLLDDGVSVDVHKHLLKAQAEINEAIEAIKYEKEND
jgi:hypothetical protein